MPMSIGVDFGKNKSTNIFLRSGEKPSLASKDIFLIYPNYSSSTNQHTRAFKSLNKYK